MFEVRLARKAIKFLDTCDYSLRERITQAIEMLKINPFYGSQIKKLHGRLESNYRYRVGDYRIIYSVDKKKRIIWIEAIGGHEVY